MTIPVVKFVVKVAGLRVIAQLVHRNFLLRDSKLEVEEDDDWASEMAGID
jgi:hypothetical protein